MTTSDRHPIGMSRRPRVITRRGFVSSVAALPAGLGVASSAAAQATPDAPPLASPMASPVAGSEGEIRQYLLAADQEVSTVYVYSIPDLALTGRLDGVSLDKHGGTIGLPDGRILFVDDKQGEALAVVIDGNGVPSIAQRTGVNLGVGASWASVDPEFRYFAVTSYIENTDAQVLNLIDLESFDNTEIPLQTREGEELTAWIGGDPSTVYVSIGGQVDSYALSDLLAGNATPASSVPVELGSHGAVIDTVNDRFVLSTAAGFEVLSFRAGTVEHEELLPWDADGLRGGQNFRPRLARDGIHILGVLTAEPDAPEAWADAEISSHITNLENDTVRRVSLGTGLVAGRWGISEPYALYAAYNGDGGNALLFGVDESQPEFGTVVATIPLDLPTQAAVPGASNEGAEGYQTAISPDGAFGFVVHGGDGIISVIDTASRSVAGQITVPSVMTGSGYVTVVEPGLVPVDLFAR